jgi:hypothetical protein
VVEPVETYVAWADRYYVKAGEPTVEPYNIRVALRALRRLYGDTRARDIGPIAYKAARQRSSPARAQGRRQSGQRWCRTQANKRAQNELGVSQQTVNPRRACVERARGAALPTHRLRRPNLGNR